MKLGGDRRASIRGDNQKAGREAKIKKIQRGPCRLGRKKGKATGPLRGVPRITKDASGKIKKKANGGNEERTLSQPRGGDRI